MCPLLIYRGAEETQLVNPTKTCDVLIYHIRVF